MSITIKRVNKTDADGKLIMEWRNDETTRKMFFNQELKEWDTFKVMFYEKYFDNYIEPFFAYLGDTKICFIGCVSNYIADPETNEKICKISLNMCPDYRGKGYGKIIIKKFIKLIAYKYPKTKKIIAEIKCVNIASSRLFLSCGFKYVEKKNICNTECLVTEYNLKRLVNISSSSG